MMSVVRFLWGDVSSQELKKFGLLSVVFFFIVGVYWMIRSLKEVIFLNTVGPLWLPYAKIFSVVALVVVLMFYAKLVDWLEKHSLIYLLSCVYGVLFIGLGLCVAHPTIGFQNTNLDAFRLLGWVGYFIIESFGSLVIAAFWSFVASTVDSVSAKKGYPIIIAGAQVGSMGGSFVVTQAAVLGISTIIMCGGVSLILVPLMIKLFMWCHPENPGKKVEKKTRTGALEGLRLLLSKPYLMGIMVVGTVYEIVGEIVNLQMKLTANSVYTSPETLAWFFGMFGVAVNALSLLFAFIGTSFVIRYFGVTFCLVMYPLSIACGILCALVSQSIWGFFGAMVALKGLSYALNNPCKEIMYVPTSKDIKFKAKSWMDGFGSRSAKALGASTIAAHQLVARYVSMISYGTIASLAIIAAWIPVAFWVGRTNSALVKNNEIVE